MRAVRIAIAAAAAFWAGAAGAQTVTSNFGVRSDPFHRGQRMHEGMDMAAATGSPVYATGDGYVRRARVAGGYGNLVEIEHGFGYETRFGHLSRILVAEGQFVRRGTMVGLVGSTGRSTGPHLHYEVRIGGRAVQPSSFMQIAFTTQPDWAQVRLAASAPAQAPVRYAAASSPTRTGRVAMARDRDPIRAAGSIALDYAGAAVRSAAPASGFSTGHVSFGR